MSHKSKVKELDKKKLYELAKQNGFSENETDQMLNLVKCMAGKPVKDYLIGYLKTRGAALGYADPLDKGYNLYRKLLANITKVETPDFTGYQSCSFKDDDKTEYHIRMQLAVVERNHEIKLEIPPMAKQKALIEQIFFYIDKLTDLGKHFYMSMIGMNGIGKDIAELFGDVDFSLLNIEKTNRSMYFDEACEKRIGIIAYYVDKE